MTLSPQNTESIDSHGTLVDSYSGTAFARARTPATVSSASQFKGATAVAKYGPKAQGKVKETMHEFKGGTLKSGPKSKKKVTDRKQAIAIGLSQARKKGAEVPPKKG
jgi:hypothetical protein